MKPKLFGISQLLNANAHAEDRQNIQTLEIRPCALCLVLELNEGLQSGEKPERF